MRVSKLPEERKEEIAQVAEKLFYEQGISKTTVNMIVKEVGVTQGLFYYYFESKDEIVNLVFNRIMDSFEKILNDMVFKEGCSFQSKLQLFCETLWIAYGEVKNRAMLDKDLLSLLYFNHDARKRLKEAAFRILMPIVNEGIKEKELSLKYPEHTVRMLIGGVEDLIVDSRINNEVIHALVQHVIR